MFLRQVLVNLVFPIPSIIVLDLITKWVGASFGRSQPLNGSTLVYIKTKLEQMYNVSK